MRELSLCCSGEQSYGEHQVLIPTPLIYYISKVYQEAGLWEMPHSQAGLPNMPLCPGGSAAGTVAHQRAFVVSFLFAV